MRGAGSLTRSSPAERLPPASPWGGASPHPRAPREVARSARRRTWHLCGHRDRRGSAGRRGPEGGHPRHFCGGGSPGRSSRGAHGAHRLLVLCQNAPAWRAHAGVEWGPGPPLPLPAQAESRGEARCPRVLAPGPPRPTGGATGVPTDLPQPEAEGALGGRGGAPGSFLEPSPEGEFPGPWTEFGKCPFNPKGILSLLLF